jgi:predicted RecA/RadA family phage recombinase
MAIYRKESNVISWTNNLTAGSGTVSKGDIVHIGNNKFGVAVDDIEFGESGELIVKGYFEAGSAIINETVTIGQSLCNYDTDIKTVAQLKTVSVNESGSATVKLDTSNLYLAEDITADSSAQSFKFILI